MNAKEYLRSARKLAFKINRLDMEIKMVESQMKSPLSGIDYSGVKVATSPDGQGFTKMVDRLADLQEERRKLSETYIDKYDQIRCEIHTLDNMVHQELLSYVYLDGMTLYDASKKMHYQYGTVRNLHSAALQAFQKDVLDPKG